MKRTLTLFTALAMLPLAAHAEDPFAAGADALAVKDSDGSSSLRAKMKLAKMEPDMIQVEVKGLDDSKYPNCVMQAKVIVAAESKDKHFKLMAKNKVYPFAPVLKMKGKQVNLKDEMTQNNLGACYYPPKTKLIVKVSGVDLKTKQFTAAAIYVK